MAKRKRILELPDEVWLALDKDAQVNRRSSPKQLQWILEDRYGLLASESVDQPPIGPDRPNAQPGNGYLMSLGNGTAPTKEEEELVRPDVEKALRFAQEHEAKKKKQRQK